MEKPEAGLKSSSARLWKLIRARTQPDADVAAIDRRVWDLFGEEWAIMYTDLAGFSRQVAKFGIVHFLQIIFEQQQLLLPLVEDNDGILIKVEADSLLILFKQPRQALDAAIAMQRKCEAINARRPAEEQIVLCVGLGYGRILKIGDDDVFGHEVNLSSKLGEDTAKGGEILVTRAFHDLVPAARWEEVAVEYAGEQLAWRATWKSRPA